MKSSAIVSDIKSFLGVIGTSFSREREGLIKVDLTNVQAVQDMFANYKPSIVIHCAAERRPDVADKDENATLALNVELPRRLAQLSKDTGAWMVYISSDSVFDGTEPPYQVESPVNPINFYGKTKLGGEKATLETSPEFAVLRIPLLYGFTESNKECSVSALFDTIRLYPNPIKMDDLTIRFPTLVDDVAKTLIRMSDARQNGKAVSGVYHYSGPDSMTKFTMCGIFGRLLGVPVDHLVPDREQPAPPTGNFVVHLSLRAIMTSHLFLCLAPRPVNPQLSTRRLEEEGLFVIPTKFEPWFSQNISHF